MDKKLLFKVSYALSLQTGYDWFEYQEHGKYAYFIAIEHGIRHGAYRIAKDWFEGKDLAQAGFGVMLMANSPLIPIS